jgi:hypothetical protein
MRTTYRSLCETPFWELERTFREGHKPDPADLEGFEFRGFNTPFFARFLGIRKFKKGFYRTDRTTVLLDGYNVRCKQNGPGEAWVDVVRRGEPVRHGFYGVTQPGGADALYPNALLIDYSLGKNPSYDPARFLRDYLVQVDPDNRDLFLGKAYVAVGPRRVPVSYFVLERHAESPLGARAAASAASAA